MHLATPKFGRLLKRNMSARLIQLKGVKVFLHKKQFSYLKFVKNGSKKNILFIYAICKSLNYHYFFMSL